MVNLKSVDRYLYWLASWHSSGGMCYNTKIVHTDGKPVCYTAVRRAYILRKAGLVKVYKRNEVGSKSEHHLTVKLTPKGLARADYLLMTGAILID